jgi:pyruvate-ferredoxin/flavodoxin oxidoreductase
MPAPIRATLDGNEAAASVAYRLSEVIAIYPITPSSTMGELSDEWAANGKKNLWGMVPQVIEMQSEGGAAGAVHGALQAGALSTTFTASQGLLLMIPNLYKIAGELTPYCMHVSARTLATHALSIFGDHQDVMACRQTGVALLCSNSIQEAHDLAAIGHAATLKSRVPFLHFFDGFRTSHEVSRIDYITDDELRQMIDENAIAMHRKRALSPDHPVVRGTAQNPDAYFQAREACNLFYDATPHIVQETMDKFAEVTGRQYRLFDYIGHPQAERVIIMMGSGAETAEETVNYLVDQGEKVGLVKVRLYRPFDKEALLEALPSHAFRIAVLDRTKEPGAGGEPLYLDIVNALHEADILERQDVLLIGGRYGLSSKEFTPACVKAVFDELNNASPRQHFTVGIVDDVTKLSLPVDSNFDIEPSDVNRSVFYGLGADGTVGANKNTIKIIGEETDFYPQGYFVYDSKKSGAMTISHLRFSPRQIQSTYLIKRANFVACHQFNFIEKHDMLEVANPGAVFLINCPIEKDKAWNALPYEVQETIIKKKIQLYVIDAFDVARKTGMGSRINTIMQTCFFAISGVLPREEAIAQIKKSIEKTYSRKGQDVVEKNFAAVDQTLANLHKIDYPQQVTATYHQPPIVSEEAPDFVKRVSAVMIAGKGDLLPVSAFPVDGTWPSGTTKWEKRALADEIPVWEQSLCIQCNKCALVCPHTAIRPKVYESTWLKGAPESFKAMDYKAPDFKGQKYSLQVAPEDCTGCNLCVEICPAHDKQDATKKALYMKPFAPLLEQERKNFDFFLGLPEADRSKVRMDVKGTQFLQPLFEFSGACSGCGETPYIKLMTQLYGDRAVIANATGCSSIFGGNLPTTPYCQNADGRGPAWNNSLFEDNAEFGLGIRLGIDHHTREAQYLLKGFASTMGEELVKATLEADQLTEGGIASQRERVEIIREKLKGIDSRESRRLRLIGDYLVRKSIWIVGGDGWAYDIGFGGLDHVIWSGHKVNLLVLDTEVYSNTGGQQSKSTPIAAAAKFAVAGKQLGKKDLGLIAMTYGNVYVARVCIGAKDAQTVKAFQEAESFNGPSLIIAYAHCIAHGIDMLHGLDQQKMAVESGAWPLYRFDPRRKEKGENPLQWDSPAPKVDLRDYLMNENRFRQVQQRDPDRFEKLLALAKHQIEERNELLKRMSLAPV